MYATAAELKQRLGELYAGLYTALDGTDLTNEASADIASAEAEINGMIGARYTVPVLAAGALPLLKNWTLTLAEELAWAKSGKADTPGNLKDRLSRVRALLDKVQSGEMVLPGVEENIDSSGIFIVEKDEPVFTREKMGGY